MTCQILIFHRKHEQEQGISFASPVFTFQLTYRIVHTLTGNVLAQHDFEVVLTIHLLELMLEIFSWFFMFIFFVESKSTMLYLHPL